MAHDDNNNLWDLIEHAPIGLYRTTPYGRVVVARTAMLSLLGYELTSRGLETAGVETFPAWGPCTELNGRNGAVVRREFEWKKPDGSTVFLRDHTRAVQADDGTVKFYEGAVEDLSELRRAEESVRSSGEFFHELARNIRGVLWFSHAEKNDIPYISSVYEELWGHTRESLYRSPRSWIDLIHPDGRDRVLDAANSEKNPGEYDQEYRIIRGDGSIRWIHDRTFPIRGPLGRTYSIAGIAEDVTDRKCAEERLRILNDVARRMSAPLDVRGVFESAVSQLSRVFNARRAAVMTTDSSTKPFDAVELIARMRSLMQFKFVTDQLESAGRSGMESS